jgi:hypothetical protein
MEVENMAVYRIGTFKVSPVKRVGDQKRDEEKTIAILKALTGVIEKRELLIKYPELGMEINGIPITGGGQNENLS